MKTIYFVRHQHHGFVTSHAFANPPTDEQLAPIVADLETRHGVGLRLGGTHQTHVLQSGSPPWWTVVDVQLLEAGEVPDIKPRGVDTGVAFGRGKVT